MSRTMSGLSTAGDVKLDGDPNAFTGTNTYNVNRPTSSLGGTPNSDDFITKQDGDTLYQGTGNVALLNGDNAFTGTTNTFDNRPAASSTPATLAGTLDFVIKRDTDLLYVTKATDQDITGKKTLEDTLTLDGASNINIGQIDLKGSVGNTIHQFTGSFGNQILQGSNTAGAPSMPLAASLIYQAGTSDIIETEGKVVCPTAPTAGNDLTNKTYVDAAIAAGGGGLDFFVGRFPTANLAVSQNVRFNTMVSSPAVNFADNGGGTGLIAGARFLADANTAGEWLIGFTGLNIAFNGIVYFTLGKVTNGGSGTSSTIGYIFNQQTSGYNNLNGIWSVSVANGDVITIRPQNNYSSNLTRQTNTFWGIKLG